MEAERKKVFESGFDLLISMLLIIVFWLLVLFIGRFMGSTAHRVSILYFWHTFFCIVYAYYVSNNGGDAFGYFERAKLGLSAFRLGTFATIWITSIPVYYFGLSFLATSLFFNLFGTIGLIALDASLAKTVRYKEMFINRIASLVVFLPSISFWSAGIGKDSIAFMAVGLILWGFQKISSRFMLVAIGLVSMALVRPHIAAFLMVAIGISMIFTRGAPLALKLLLAGLSAVSAYFILPIVLHLVGIDELSSTNQLEEFINKRQGYNLDGGSSLDISSMSLPQQLFTYAFRPLFFDANSIPALLSSIDNLFLLLLSLLTIFTFSSQKRFMKSSNNIYFLIIFVVITWLALAQTTANLGIALRQKWMFMPALLVVIFHLHGDRRQWKRSVRRFSLDKKRSKQ